MRAFLAIMPSQTILKQLSLILKDLAFEHPHKLRFTEIHKLHLTLHFFSNLELAQLKPTIATLDTLANSVAKIPICLEKKLLLPSNKQAQTLAYQIKASPELIQLRFLLEQLFLGMGHQNMHEQFLPHITIARSKDSGLLQKITLPTLEACFTAKEIVLFESLPEQGEFQYRPIEIFSFKRKT